MTDKVRQIRTKTNKPVVLRFCVKSGDNPLNELDLCRIYIISS